MVETIVTVLVGCIVFSVLLALALSRAAGISDARTEEQLRELQQRPEARPAHGEARSDDAA